MRVRTVIASPACVAALWSACVAGDFSALWNDPSNSFDAPVPGFIGPHGPGKARLDTGQTDGFGAPVFENPENYRNPLFFGWAANVVDYLRADGNLSFADPEYALGPVTGDNFDVVSLGDLNAQEIMDEYEPGQITIELGAPVSDLSGADFVVFENGHVAQWDGGGAGAGSIFAELAYVEVSTDGENFVRFPSTSLNPPLAGLPSFGTQYASLDATNVHNLAGKHVNAYGDCWGTPFDLADVGLTGVTHIRIVDIPGNGSFVDKDGRPIYDAWKTLGSGGFDLEAVGVVSTPVSFDTWPPLAELDPAERAADDDPDSDGLCNLLEYAFGLLPWRADAGGAVGFERQPGGLPSISFPRDERASDLSYQIEAASSPLGPWTTIARSTSGGPVLAEAGVPVVISDSSASDLASIGVLRRVTVVDSVPSPGRGFYRVKVSRNSASMSPP